MRTRQEIELRKVIKDIGPPPANPPLFPGFQDFIKNYLPESLMSFLWESGGGKQTAEATATLEYLYSIYIAIVAGDAVFEISPDIITALRDTDISSALVNELRPPFEGIIIDIPVGTFAPPGEQVSRLIVTRVDGDKRFRMVCQNSEDYTSYVNFLVDDNSITIIDALARTENYDLGIPNETTKTTTKQTYSDLQSILSYILRLTRLM